MTEVIDNLGHLQTVCEEYKWPGCFSSRMVADIFHWDNILGPSMIVEVALMSTGLIRIFCNPYR